MSGASFCTIEVTATFFGGPAATFKLNPMNTAAQHTALTTPIASIPFFIVLSLCGPVASRRECRRPAVRSPGTWAALQPSTLTCRSEGKRRIRPEWDRGVPDGRESNPRYHPPGYQTRASKGAACATLEALPAKQLDIPS